MTKLKIKRDMGKSLLEVVKVAEEKIVEDMFLAFLDWLKEPMPDYCTDAKWKWATFKEKAIAFKEAYRKMIKN
jgi:hypoxanthine phosphoribosyltransferase